MAVAKIQLSVTDVDLPSMKSQRKKNNNKIMLHTHTPKYIGIASLSEFVCPFMLSE